MKKLIVVFVIIALLFVVYLNGWHEVLSLETLKQQQTELALWVDNNLLLASLSFLALYIIASALSIPGAVWLTLGGGAIFGLGLGTILVSFASTIGATLAMIVARYLLQDLVSQKFPKVFEKVNEGIDKDGAFYLFSMRLVPAFPYFLINLVMGLTRLRLSTFYWVSQLGMLPATVVYVNAGTQLAQIDTIAGIASPALILSFVLLAVFPWTAKMILARVKAKQIYKGYQRPKRFDNNLLVIGAGSGGLVASYIAAAVKSKVTLIEKSKMGGDCLNTGCVPSKALIRAAHSAHEVRTAASLGVNAELQHIEFKKVMSKVHEVIRKIEPHDSEARYRGLGVEVIHGEARIISPWQVEVNGEVISSKHIVIASGARPMVPPLPGIEGAPVLTSDNLWQLQELPKRLVVLGGGPIGCELAQAFNRLGSVVTQVEMGEFLLPKEDADVSEFVQAKFQTEGIEVLVSSTAQSVRQQDGQWLLQLSQGDKSTERAFDYLLVAVGRQANVKGFGLEELGVQLTERRTVAVDGYLRTNFPNIFAVGDVAGPYQLTHAASHMAWYAAVNALFGRIKRFKVDYSVMPWATFIDPEVARVGLSESEANAQGLAYEVTRYDLDDLDRAIADQQTEGWVKVLTVPGRDKILGVCIVGAKASELLSEYTLAMKHGLGLNKILGTIHVYPTQSEANKYVAGNWKRAHQPHRLLRWVERYHRWQRGA